MKLRLHARRSFQYQHRESWAEVLCTQLDRAIAPAGTACLVMGLMATYLHLSETADYMLATGLLFHLTVWFARWLGTVRTRAD